MVSGLSRASVFPLVVSLLAVDIVIISGIVVRISHLYIAGTYMYNDWVIGVAVTTLMCMVVLHAFVGYTVITSKKLYKRVLISTTLVQVMSITAVTVIVVDLVMFIGLIASVAATAALIALLLRTPSR